jgi:hypothetical protein
VRVSAFENAGLQRIALPLHAARFIEHTCMAVAAADPHDIAQDRLFR